MNLTIESGSDSWVEDFLDIEPYVSGAISNFVLFPVKLAEKVIETALSIFVVLEPDEIIPIISKEIQKKNPKAGPFKELTKSSIVNDFYDKEKLPIGCRSITNEQVYATLDKVEKIAKRLNISNKLKVYSSESENLAFTIGTRFAQNAIPIYISPDIMTLSEESVDFVIGHEMSHIAHNDSFYQMIYNISVIALSVITLILCPLALPFFSACQFLAGCYLKQTQEREADIEAMTLTKTNKGAIGLFYTFSILSRATRKQKILEYKENPDSYFNTGSTKTNLLRLFVYYFSKSTPVISISPEGNNREDLSHPALSDRISFAKNFRPQGL